MKAASEEQAIQEALAALENVAEEERKKEIAAIATTFGYDLTEEDLAIEEEIELSLDEMSCRFFHGGWPERIREKITSLRPSAVCEETEALVPLGRGLRN